MSSSSQSQQKYQPSSRGRVTTSQNFTEAEVDDGARKYGAAFRRWVVEGKVYKVVRNTDTEV